MSVVWVLTREINDYNQDGAYFEAIFKEKPTLMELADYFSKRSTSLSSSIEETIVILEHIRSGGGRRDLEHEWFHLEEYSLLSYGGQ